MEAKNILCHLIKRLPIRLFQCHGCGDSSFNVICTACHLSLVCNHQMIEPNEDGVRGIFPIFFAFPTTHKILVYWKNHGGKLLSDLLFSPSPALLMHLRSMQFDFVIAIPQNEERNLSRGHASAYEVAKFFSKILNVPLLQDYLILKNTTFPKQASLNQWERRYNENPFSVLHSNWRVNNHQISKRILLVDDFITSGSTIEKAANVILKKNPNVQIYAASLGYRLKNTEYNKI